MRTDILDLHAFYESPLGRTARGFLAGHLAERWGDAARLRLAGFGHAGPFLEAFGQAERVIALAPGGQGAMHWPQGALNRAGLVEETHWPLPDASIDRLLIVHGLEEAGDPRRLMREAWRVLRPGGAFLIRDLYRPPTFERALELVALHAAGETPYNRELFRASLHAALTFDELSAAAAEAELTGVELVVDSDRHMSLQRAAALAPHFLQTRANLAMCYAELDRIPEAQAEVAELGRINPNFSLAWVTQRVPFKDPAIIERMVAAFRKAGLK